MSSSCGRRSLRERTTVSPPTPLSKIPIGERIRWLGPSATSRTVGLRTVYCQPLVARRAGGCVTASQQAARQPRKLQISVICDRVWEERGGDRGYRDTLRPAGRVAT